MDGSLQIDRWQDVQSPEHSYQCETNSNLDISDKGEHHPMRSPGGRPISRDTISNVHLDASKASAHTQEWVHKAPALPPKGYPLSQGKLRARRGTEAAEMDSLGTNGGSDIPRPETSGYMGSSTKAPDDVHHISRLDAVGRRRSQSIGPGSRGSRIAALSVQLRTRLSYAAAKIEKKRHSHTVQYKSPTGLLQKNSSTPTLSLEALPRAALLLSMDDMEDQRLAENNSPNGTTVSAPDPPATSSSHPLEASMRQSRVNIASDLYPQLQPDPQRYLGRASSEHSSPRLAPPADIGPSRVRGQRRRPNPNIASNTSRYAPFPHHGRHRSQQELRIDPEVVRVPETPPLRPSTHNNIAPYNGLPDSSQSSSMEQDAIETLLFMSSPGTSGYNSNSQNPQHNPRVRNIDSSASQSVQWHGKLGDSQSSSRQHGPLGNIETQAGDEIDLILDQMNSGSDDDTNCTPSRSTGADADSRAIGAVGHNVQHGT